MFWLPLEQMICYSSNLPYRDPKSMQHIVLEQNKQSDNSFVRLTGTT